MNNPMYPPPPGITGTSNTTGGAQPGNAIMIPMATPDNKQPHSGMAVKETGWARSGGMNNC